MLIAHFSKCRKVDTRVYTGIAAGHEIDDRFRDEAGNCGAADVLKEQCRQVSLLQARRQSINLETIGAWPRCIGGDQSDGSALQSEPVESIAHETCGRPTRQLTCAAVMTS